MFLFIRSLCYIVLLCATTTLFPALIIFEQHKDNTLHPLSEENKDFNQKISEIILKYEWPMSIASASKFTEEEKNELFSDTPAAEEQFIQKRINAEFEKDKNHKNRLPKPPTQYVVAFIPTALYQLFALWKVLKPEVKEIYFKQIRRDDIEDQRSENQDKPKKININLAAILNDESQESSFVIRNNVLERYHSANKTLFLEKSNDYLHINNQLITWLNEKELVSLDPSENIKKNIKYYTQELVEKTIKYLQHGKWDEGKSSNGLSWLYSMNRDERASIFKFIEKLEKEESTKIIAKIIALEYEARNKNRALLLRGSSILEVQTGFKQKFPTNQLIGSTISSSKERPLEYQYSQKDGLRFRSVSFGNNLFDGALKDPTACVYNFLNGEGVGVKIKQEKKIAGYSLFIDKMSYIDSQCNRLFFISPLAPLTSLFHKGEFFHSRTTAAINKKIEATFVPGVMNDRLLDRAGIILITRDPLYHAQLFSQFLAENGYLIQLGDTSQLTEQEKKIAQEIMSSQRDATLFYHQARNVFPIIHQHIQDYKQHRFDDKQLYVIALDKGYGYHYAYQHSIPQLQEHLKRNNFLETIKPTPCIALSSPHAQAFLKNRCKIDLEQEWHTLLKNHFQEPDSRNNAITENTFPPAFINDCEKLKQEMLQKLEAFITTNQEFSFEQLFSIEENNATPLPTRSYVLILDDIEPSFDDPKSLHILMGLAHHDTEWELFGGTLDQKIDSNPIAGTLRELWEESMKVFNLEMNPQVLQHLITVDYDKQETVGDGTKNYFYTDFYKKDIENKLFGTTALYLLDFRHHQNMQPFFSANFTTFFNNTKKEDLKKITLDEIKKNYTNLNNELILSRRTRKERINPNLIYLIIKKKLATLKGNDLANIMLYHRFFNSIPNPSEKEEEGKGNEVFQEMIDFHWVDIKKLYELTIKNNEIVGIAGFPLDPYTKINLKFVLEKILYPEKAPRQEYPLITLDHVRTFITNAQTNQRTLTLAGNQTNQYHIISPAIKNILETIKNILSEQFSKESLLQQLSAQHEKFFTYPLSTPIFIQEEPHINDETPVYGKLFTTDPTGDQLVERDASGFRKGRPGITTIHSWYGIKKNKHNADTFYVDQSNDIYSAIRRKEHNGKVIEQPSLNNDQILKLKKLATLMESFYRQPMIVNFAFNENTIIITNITPLPSMKPLNNENEYPLPLELSLFVNENFPGESFNNDVIKKELEDGEEEMSWDALLQKMRTKRNISAKDYVGSFITKLITTLHPMIANKDTTPAQKEAITNIFRYANHLTTKILKETAYNKTTSDGPIYSYTSKIRRRFYVRLLEALVKQPPNNGIINNYSVAQFKEKIALIHPQEKIKPDLIESEKIKITRIFGETKATKTLPFKEVPLSQPPKIIRSHLVEPIKIRRIFGDTKATPDPIKQQQDLVISILSSKSVIKDILPNLSQTYDNSSCGLNNAFNRIS